MYKDPIADRTKQSKRGRLELFRDSDGSFFTAHPSSGDVADRLLETVFENGVLLREQSFEAIRNCVRGFAAAELPEEETAVS